jgi:hypothetical protein
LFHIVSLRSLRYLANPKRFSESVLKWLDIIERCLSNVLNKAEQAVKSAILPQKRKKLMRMQTITIPWEIMFASISAQARTICILR